MVFCEQYTNSKSVEFIQFASALVFGSHHAHDLRTEFQIDLYPQTGIFAICSIRIFDIDCHSLNNFRKTDSWIGHSDRTEANSNLTISLVLLPSEMESTGKSTRSQLFPIGNIFFPMRAFLGIVSVFYKMCGIVFLKFIWFHRSKYHWPWFGLDWFGLVWHDFVWNEKSAYAHQKKTNLIMNPSTSQFWIQHSEFPSDHNEN